MKQNGLMTAFEGLDKNAARARIIFSVPIDAQHYNYPYKVHVDISVHNIFQILSCDSCTRKFNPGCQHVFFAQP
jgi:hypothetical protein